MSTWIDPNLEDALATSDLIAIADVKAASPAGARVELVRVFAGDKPAGATVEIDRAAIVGVGHAGDTLPVDRFLFMAKRKGEGRYVGLTDSSWVSRLSEGESVHVPIRDPFTRAYVKLDDFAALVTLVRDRQKAPDAFLEHLVVGLLGTPVVATKPLEVNEQIITLEALALLGGEAHAGAARSFLASPHFQIRWSAVRALARCGGAAATPALVELLGREEIPPVQAALVQALRDRVTAAHRAALEAALPRMYDQDILLSRNIMNPAMNTLRAPRAELQALLSKV